MATHAYTNAVEKLEYIRTCLLAGRRVPTSQLLSIVEALQLLHRVVEGMIREPKFITPKALSALRQLIEVRVMPVHESAPEAGLRTPGTPDAQQNPQ